MSVFQFHTAHVTCMIRILLELLFVTLCITTLLLEIHFLQELVNCLMQVHLLCYPHTDDFNSLMKS